MEEKGSRSAPNVKERETRRRKGNGRWKMEKSLFDWPLLVAPDLLLGQIKEEKSPTTEE
jgi:hypothetical protein